MDTRRCCGRRLESAFGPGRVCASPVIGALCRVRTCLQCRGGRLMVQALDRFCVGVVLGQRGEREAVVAADAAAFVGPEAFD